MSYSITKLSSICNAFNINNSALIYLNVLIVELPIVNILGIFSRRTSVSKQYKVLKMRVLRWFSHNESGLVSFSSF